LNYYHKGNIVLFKCDWIHSRVHNKWVRTDEFGITSFKFKYLFNTGEKISDEPFILASQASQVYYIVDLVETKWAAVVQPKPRDLYRSDDVENKLLDDSNEVDVIVPNLNPNGYVCVVPGHVPCARTDIDGIIVSGIKHGK
jgi:hypothetical protein